MVDGATVVEGRRFTQLIIETVRPRHAQSSTAIVMYGQYPVRWASARERCLVG